MKIRNISDRVIEKTESGVTHVLSPGDEVAVEAVINAESWERWAPGAVARVYEEGEWAPPIAPEGALIVGLNYEAPDAPVNEDGSEGSNEPTEATETSEDPESTEAKRQVRLQDLDSLTRDELNDQVAPVVGIEDPKAYKTKSELIQVIVEVAQQNPLYI